MLFIYTVNFGEGGKNKFREILYTLVKMICLLFLGVHRKYICRELFLIALDSDYSSVPAQICNSSTIVYFLLSHGEI